MADVAVTPQVSVIIPNYNGAALLPKHLPKIFACLHDTDEVIVVDDASTDDSVAWLRTKFDLQPLSSDLSAGTWSYKQSSGVLKLLRNRTNLRFAATCNKGVEQSQGELLFLVNTDVSPLADCRNSLVKWFSNTAVFAVGCLEYEDSQRGQESGKNELWFERGLFIHSKARDMQTGPTAWVSGGSGMFRKSMWQKLNGFDLKFSPAYWEDIDLSFRAQKKGFSVLFDRAAAVLHQHETTNSHTFSQRNLLRMSWKSSDYFARKHASAIQLIQYFLWRPFWWWKRFALLHKMR